MLNPKIKYTNVDQQEIFNELIKRIPLLTNRWTDFNASDIGITLVDLYSGSAAINLFYLDKKAQDLYLPTVRTSESLYSLAKMVGYQIKSRMAARTTLRFTVNNPTTTVIIPPFTRCSTQASGISGLFVTVEPGIISPGDFYTEVEAWQGTKAENQFTSPGIAGFKATLYSPVGGNPISTKVASGSITTKVDGVLWTEVEDFSASTEIDKHYVVETNYDKSVSIVFGDGYNGSIPANNADIRISFIETEGATGNWGSGSVTKCLDIIYDSLGVRVDVGVTNPTEAAGGKNEETLYHAKKLIPARVRTHNRAVTKEDFIYWAENFPGILQARVVDVTDYPINIIELDYYQVRVVVIPEAGKYVSQRTKALLYQELTYEKGKYVTCDIDVIDPEYLDINVTFRAIYDRAYTLDDVRTRVNATIANYLKPSETPYHERILTGAIDGQYIGEDVDYITLASQLNNVEGIISIQELTLSCIKGDFGFNQPQQNVPVDRYEMPTANRITLGLTPYGA